MNKTICLPFEQNSYEKIVSDSVKFRKYLDRMIEAFPELFPKEIEKGYRMKDSYYSKKQSLRIRRIEVENSGYSIRPSFVMPYMTALTSDVEKILFLRKFAVPFCALSYSFGKNPMYWYRMEQSIGRNSIVGTTINDPSNLPDHLLADEKHTRLRGKKAYVATTVGKNCVLGVCPAQSVSTHDLTLAYGEFKKEAQILKPDYSPETVNLDGWEQTHSAWKALFTPITVILCFLHFYIKIRDSLRRNYPLLQNIAERLWNCYKANSRHSFSQRVRRFFEWAINNANLLPDTIFQKIVKLYKTCDSYAIAYHFPNAHRTSNMLERLMNRMDRFLFSIQYFHGNMFSAKLAIRSWALIHNFAPLSPNAIKKHKKKSFAEILNGYRYHDCWLQNLLISASLGGYRTPPQNPL